jgi:hypothetical protein
MRIVRLLPLLCACVAVSGCFGGGNRYAKYQHQRAAIRQVDQLLAHIPQITGARVMKRTEESTVYKVGPNQYINAEPYRTNLEYIGPPGLSGERIQKHFRLVLRARGWHCQFQRGLGAPFTFACTRGLAGIQGVIGARSQYELSLSASSARPHIHVVQGD